jgi:hypothetical protein
VAEIAVERLVDDTTLFSRGEGIVSRARRDLANYLKTGEMCDALVESALLLATLDPIYRAGVGHEMIGLVDRDDLQDLRSLIAAVDQNLFTAQRLCLLNPTFGRASRLVAGADADWVVVIVVVIGVVEGGGGCRGEGERKREEHLAQVLE